MVVRKDVVADLREVGLLAVVKAEALIVVVARAGHIQMRVLDRDRKRRRLHRAVAS